MELLPSSMRRHLLCHWAGIVALIVMVLPLFMCRHLCSPVVFAVVEITVLPSLWWRFRHCQAGVLTLVTMASSPSSMRRRLCNCHDGIIALVVLASLPTLHGHYCPCCTSVVVLIVLTSSPSRCMGVITIIAHDLLPPSSWCVCTVALMSLLLSHWYCSPWYTGISTLVSQAS